MATLVLAIEVRAQTPPAPAAATVPPPHESIPQGEWRSGALRQESAGKLRKLHSLPEDGGEVPYQAWVESSTLLFRADEVEWDEATGDVHASGHVYFHDFREQHELWCDRLEYNTDEESGKFYNIRGQTIPHLTARPGVLTTTSPFFFQGDWAERSGDLYILHDGFVTNCKMPSPWWRMKGPRFVIQPGEKALAYHTVFLLGGVPLFFAPYFYHSLEAEPRKSGFLLPNIGNSSKGGFLLGAGYYWAINRSHDLTYRVLAYTSRGLAHHRRFPRETSRGHGVLRHPVRRSGSRPARYEPTPEVQRNQSLRRRKLQSGRRLDCPRRSQLHHLAPLPPGMDELLQRGRRLGNALRGVFEQELG